MRLYLAMILMAFMWVSQVSLEARRVEVVNFRDLTVRFNYYYRKGYNRPFTGRAVIRHKNQNLLLEINFKNGRFHGAVRTFFSDGRLKDEAYWENGNVVKITKTVH